MKLNNKRTKAMKQKFNTLIIFCAVCLVTLASAGEEHTRKYSQSWPAANVETLSISNKFGEVKVNNDGGNTITVDVVVTAEGSEERAERILKDISVNFSHDGKTAVAETRIADGFRSNGRFTIDYTVNVPSEKNLVIRNKYGNVFVNKMTGNTNIEIAYGNLTANSLTGPFTHLDVAYGKADVQSMAKAEVDISYSKFFLNSGTALKLESKYSGLNADKLEDLQVESKYDSFSLGEINNLEGNSKYTNYKIARLNKKLKIESGYGTIKIDQIPAGFEWLEVHSSYAQVSLGIAEDAGYQLDAGCDYCDISYPHDKFKGNRMVENNKQNLKGKIASGSPGVVTVVSRYGNIRLTK
jgi:hypothetical protein